MLQISVKYEEKMSVDSNPTKIVFVAFSRQKIFVKTGVKLCGAMLRWVEKVKYLVNHLQYNLCEAIEVTMKKKDIIQRLNNLLVTLR